MDWAHNLVEWTINLSNHTHANWWLFIIAFSESSFFPVPPDLLQIALSVGHPEKAFLYAGVSLCGTILGAAFGYAIGMIGGRPFIRKILKPHYLQLAEKYFHKYDCWAIALAGFTPIPYKVFAVSGGVFKIRFSTFIWVSILSRGLRFFLVATGMYFFGDKAKEVILHNINLFGIIVLVMVLAGFGFFALMSKLKPHTEKMSA